MTATTSRLGHAVKRGARYALSVLQNRVGATPKPSWCTFLVCNRCNARCGMCDSWRLERGKEITPAEVRAVFAQLGSLDVVRLSGGEPFLRADLLELGEAILAASRPLVLHVTTNGSFPERVLAFARGFSQPERLRFLVSFDGLPAEHDRNRGRAVSFEKAFSTVERLVAERHRGLEVSVNHTVISAESLAAHAELAARFEPLGVDVQTVLAYESSAMYGEGRRGTRADDLVVRDGYPLHEALEGADAAGFVATELARLGSLSPGIRLAKQYYLSGLHARLTGQPTPQPHPRCVALRSHIRLLPDGSVPVCQFNTEPVGNLAEQHFNDVWRGPATQRAREWVDRCAGCWAECEVMPNAVYSGDLLTNALTAPFRGP